MDFRRYAEVWRLPGVREAALLGALGKAPWFGAGVILTLHVVGALGQSYSAAGVLTGAFTVAVAVASPWRGRLLDTIGLRRTLLPSLVILPPAFLAVPFVGYWPLLASMVVVGLMAVPWFVLTRQMMMAAAPVEHRRTVLALDSVLTELSFMVGPTLGVLAAVSWHSGWALTLFALLSVAGAAALWWRNPPLTAESTQDAGAERGGVRAWLNWTAVSTFMATVAVTFTLAGTDLAIVAAVRAMDATGWLTVVLVAWGAGSLVGGLVYGSFQGRTIPMMTLVVGLALTTLVGAAGTTPALLAAAMALAGLFCAPSLAATVERLSHAVPDAYRGEAMGWQGTFSTLGNAVAPPLVGFALDAWGWQSGFLATGAMGLFLGVAGWAALSAGRRAHARRASRAGAT